MILFKRTREDIRSIMERDPAARSALEVFLLYPGFQAVLWHRLAHRLYKARFFFLARLISQIVAFFTRIEIHPGAEIGRGLFIDHGTGVVIGETAQIGDYCTIYQSVTLGGTGKEKGKRHPTLGNHVMVGSGAKILGPFTVGDYARVAANAVVLDEIPPYATAVGVPARVVKIDGRRTDNADLDHIHTPDPISQELCKLRAQIERLENRLKQLEKEKEKEEEH